MQLKGGGPWLLETQTVCFVKHAFLFTSGLVHTLSDWWMCFMFTLLLTNNTYLDKVQLTQLMVRYASLT